MTERVKSKTKSKSPFNRTKQSLNVTRNQTADRSSIDTNTCPPLRPNNSHMGKQRLKQKLNRNTTEIKTTQNSLPKQNENIAIQNFMDNQDINLDKKDLKDDVPETNLDKSLLKDIDNKKMIEFSSPTANRSTSRRKLQNISVSKSSMQTEIIQDFVEFNILDANKMNLVMTEKETKYNKDLSNETPYSRDKSKSIDQKYGSSFNDLIKKGEPMMGYSDNHLIEERAPTEKNNASQVKEFKDVVHVMKDNVNNKKNDLLGRVKNLESYKSDMVQKQNEKTKSKGQISKIVETDNETSYYTNTNNNATNMGKTPHNTIKNSTMQTSLQDRNKALKENQNMKNTDVVQGQDLTYRQRVDASF